MTNTTPLLGPEHALVLQLLEEAGAARRGNVVASERKAREEEFAQRVRRILRFQLNDEAENAKREAASVSTAAAKDFTAWCRGREMILPITGTTAAAYIIDRLLADTDMASLRQAARAVSYIHEVGEWYLDQKPIRAALAFAELTHGFASGGPDDPGGGQVVPINPSPSPPASDYAELPLAAGAAS